MTDDLLKPEQMEQQITLIDMCEKIYRDALSVIDNDVKDLVHKGKEMAALALYAESIDQISKIHSTLSGIYKLMYNNQNILRVYGSLRLSKVSLGLKPIVDVMDDPEATQQEIESYVMKGIREAGVDKYHHFINQRYILELEYMISTLRVLVEPDYIPLDLTEDEELEEEIDRHIPSMVKMYVWQRDKGQCVKCGTIERLEYDHIIPVSKGGSNTERNIQLLCERCNRQKGGAIQ